MFEHKFLVAKGCYFKFVKDITQVWEDGVEFLRTKQYVNDCEITEVIFWGDEEELFNDLLKDIHESHFVKAI